MTRLLSEADYASHQAKHGRARPQSTVTEPTPYVVDRVSLKDIFAPMARPVKAAKKAVPTESQEQIAVIKWCDTQPLAKYIFAIPNGANKSMASAAKFKREGLRKGVPDLMLPIPCNGFHGLFIELKRTKGSVTSKEQRGWIALLHQAGYAAFVCRGADEAIDRIKAYLSA